jgi:hypothetical protein
VKVGNRFVITGALNECVHIPSCDARFALSNLIKNCFAPHARNIRIRNCVSSQISDKKKLTQRSFVTLAFLSDPHSFPRRTTIFTRQHISYINIVQTYLLPAF